MTSNEGEVAGGFNFNEWISHNGLDSVKNIFIRHNATTPQSLTISCDEFKAVMQDPLLFQQSHMIPKILDAIQNINQQRFAIYELYPCTAN